MIDFSINDKDLFLGFGDVVYVGYLCSTHVFIPLHFKMTLRLSFAVSSTCAECVAGKFASAVGASICADCGAGTYSEAAGATACQPCPSGTYSANTGAWTCTNSTHIAVGILGFLVVVALLGLAFYLWRKNKISKVAPAHGDIDPENATVSLPPAPCLRGDEATVRAQALANYEVFHNLPAGTATEDQVTWSSAGIQRWAAADRDTQAEGWGLTRQSSAMDGAGVVAEAAGAGLGDESLTDEELAMQFLRQEEEEEERRQREDEASLALARELKHDVDPASAPPLEEVQVAAELLEPLAQDADQHAGPGQVQNNQALDKDTEVIVERALRMQVPVLFFVFPSAPFPPFLLSPLSLYTPLDKHPCHPGYPECRR